MKTVLALFVALVGLSASAQSLVAPQPALQVVPTPTIPPGTPALIVPVPVATVPTVPVVTPVTTNLSVLATLLVNLQTATEDLLPWLTNFNNDFDLATLQTVSRAAVPSLSPSIGFDQNFSLTVSTNLLGTAQGATAPTPSGFGVTTPAVSPGTFSLPPGFANSAQSRDTLRALLILQNDLERLLPTLTALNGGTNVVGAPGLTPGFTPGPFTNIFGGVVFGP